MRRPSTGPSDCDGEKEDRIDEGVPSTRPEQSRVEAAVCASADREGSALINGPKEGVAVVSAI